MSASSTARSSPFSVSVMLYLAIGIALIAVAIWRGPADGWGGIIWLAGFVGMGVIRAPFAQRTRANTIVQDRKTVMEGLLLGGMLLSMMVLPLIHLAFGIFQFADYSLPVLATMVGAMLLLPFLWLFWRSHADLGQNWSATLEIRENHGLVTQGIYARLRHPMYAAIWLAAIAQPLLIHNWIGGFLVLPAFAAMYFLRVPQEEAMMRARFGAEYDLYAAHTGRLWPRLGRAAGVPS